MTYRLPLEVLIQRAQTEPNKPMLHQPVNRQWQVSTQGEVEQAVRKVAQGLLNLGLQRGDRVAIMAKNSAEWFIADWGIMMAGLISVPVYPTANQKTLSYVLKHSDAKAIFVGKLDDKTAASETLKGEIPRIAFPYDTIEADHSWIKWLSETQPLTNFEMSKLDDTMSIVYTSGSTGDPKGVVISFRNYASVCETHAKSMGMSSSDRVVSYLPLAHITERGVIQGPGLYGNCTFYFVESLDTFVEDLKVANATHFLSVPRLWTRFQTGVFEKLPAKKLQRLLKIPLLGSLIARKIRKGLGINEARLHGSGSAPISPSILEWYRTIGINITEGWGMTETSGLSCSNLPFRADRIGTIGVPVDCVEMKISEAGEILIRGDAVFKEYYQNEAATKESFVDGWFKTGDKAEKTASGAYRIFGRMKESFKTSKGKYVVPVPIESALAANPDIEQICVMGSGRKQPVAIVVLAEHLQNADRSQLTPSLEQTLKDVNIELEPHQKLDCIIVAKDSWSIENQMLTPTLKIRRSELEMRYDAIAQSTESGGVVWED